MSPQEEMYTIAKRTLTKHGYTEWMDALFINPFGTVHQFNSIEDIDAIAVFERPSRESLDFAIIDKILREQDDLPTQPVEALPAQPEQDAVEPQDEPEAEQPEQDVEPAQATPEVVQEPEQAVEDATEKRRAVA